jgi:hypothetical protein
MGPTRDGKGRIGMRKVVVATATVAIFALLVSAMIAKGPQGGAGAERPRHRLEN